MVPLVMLLVTMFMSFTSDTVSQQEVLVFLKMYGALLGVKIALYGWVHTSGVLSTSG